jgi:hypothetical protein
MGENFRLLHFKNPRAGAGPERERGSGQDGEKKDSFAKKQMGVWDTGVYD